MLGPPKVFRYLPCALWQFVFVCVARDTVLSTKKKHIILHYIQRNSKDMTIILRYKMDARCLWQFLFFSSAPMVLEIIKSVLMIIQMTQSLESPLPCAARLGLLC